MKHKPTLNIQPDPLNDPDAPVRVAIVTSRYNAWITDKLREGALEALARLTDGHGEALTVTVSGALELPFMVDELAKSTAQGTPLDAIVALGCIIQGDTTHDQHLSNAIFPQLVRTSCESGIPVGVGVLTVHTPEQAEARAGGTLGNKGAEAMEAALDAIAHASAIRAMDEYELADDDAAHGEEE